MEEKDGTEEKLFGRVSCTFNFGSRTQFLMETNLNNKNKNINRLHFSMKENEETRRSEKQNAIIKEQEDIAKGEAEREKIEKFTKEEEQKVKRDIMSQFRDFLREREEHKKMLEQEDKEQDIVIGIYAEAKHKMECKRKAKEKEVCLCICPLSAV